MNNFETLKKYTHKENESEVFIKYIKVINDNNFTSECILPKNHEHYGDSSVLGSNINPMLLLEIARQVETYLSHTVFNISLENKFILKKWSLHYSNKVINTIDSLLVNVTTKFTKSENQKSNIFNIEFKHNQQSICSIIIDVAYVGDVAYKKIRGTKNKIKKAPSYKRKIVAYDLGYHDENNVIITDLEKIENKYRVKINIPLNNKTYNDHKQDHITGMNITESSKQLCYLYLRKIKKEYNNVFTLTEITASFFNYIEIDEVSFIELSEPNIYGNRYEFKTYAIQNGCVMAFIVIKMEREMNKITKLLIEMFGVKESDINEQKMLSEMGMDSISIVELQVEISREFKIDESKLEMDSNETLNELIEKVRGLCNEG